MCMVSNIGDGWTSGFPKGWPNVNPAPAVPEVNRYEFEALKKEMEELKKLLEAAKKYDEATGQPDCEVDEKVAFIKKIADAVGVDMEDVFGKQD